MCDVPVRGVPAFARAGHVCPVYRVRHIRREVHEQLECRVWDQHDTGFDKYDACFDEHYANVNEHDARFNEHDARFNEHDARFDQYYTKVN